MRIVLCELTNAQKSVQHTALFMTVYKAKLEKALGHVTVGVNRITVDKHVPNAVHGLDAIHLFIDFGEVHVLAIVVVMSRLLPGFLAQKLRALHNGIATFQMLALPEVFQDGAHEHALGQPEDHAGSNVLEKGKEAQFPTELSVIAALGLLHLVEIVFQGFFIRKGSAVDAGKHAVLLIAAPVGSGNGSQANMVAKARIRHVRTTTQVHKIAKLVERDIGLTEVVDDFDLVFLAHGPEFCPGLVTGHFRANEGNSCRSNTVHFRFYLFEITLSEGLFHIKVIVEAVLDGGPNGHKCIGEELFHGKGHDVGSGMPDHFQSFGTAGNNGGYLGAASGQGRGKIICLAVYGSSHDTLELLAAHGRLEHGRNVRVFCHGNCLSFYTDIHGKEFLRTMCSVAST